MQIIDKPSRTLALIATVLACTVLISGCLSIAMAGGGKWAA